MATDLEFVESIVRRLDEDCAISYRKMFGEYTAYLNGKVVALLCDNQLFVKATEAGRSFLGDPVEAAPYPGAKLAFLIEDRLEDGRWLTELLTLTEAALPMPRPKAKRTPKAKRQAKR